MVSDPVPWLRSVRRSHERLAAQVGELPVSAYSDPSYDDEWSIAQVLSHLGSQQRSSPSSSKQGLRNRGPVPVRLRSDLGQMEQQDCSGAGGRQHRGQRGAPRPAGGPRQRAAHSLPAGDVRDGPRHHGLLRMRLSEHAVHSWDVAVTIDPSAEVTADAVELLIDGLPDLAARAGKPTDGIEPIAVSTTTPNATSCWCPKVCDSNRRATGPPTRWNCPPRRFSDSSTGASTSHTRHGDVHTSGVTSTNFGRCSRVLSPGSVRRTRRARATVVRGSTPVLPYSPQAGASCL